MSRTELKSRGSDLNLMTDKERKFCLEYLVDLNGTQAAIRAGYAAKNADVTAAKLLKKKHIQKAVGLGSKQALAKTRLEVDRILEELEACAYRSAEDLIDMKTGELKPLNKLPKDVLKAINSIKQKKTILTNREGETYGETIETEIKLVNKEVALDMAMKYRGLYKDDNEQKGDKALLIVPWDKLYAPANEKDVVEDRIAEAQKRIVDSTAEEKK